MNLVSVEEVLKGNENTTYLVDLHVKSFEVKESATGNNYANLVLGDAEHEVPSKMWNISQAATDFLSKTEFIRAKVTLNIFNGKKQFIVQGVLPIPETELNISKLRKTAPESVDSLVDYLEKCIHSIDDKAIKFIVGTRWNRHKNEFVKSVAAKSMHHNYSTGLLYHTVSMLRLASTSISQYPNKLDKDIMYGSIILHDMDKIQEYQGTEKPVVTEIGSKMGHVFLSGAEAYMLWKQYQQDNPNENTSKCIDLIHSILAHHGKKEWGSPVEPQTLEAQTVHQIDMLDSRINMKY